MAAALTAETATTTTEPAALPSARDRPKLGR